MTLTNWQLKLKFWEKHPEKREEHLRKKRERSRKTYQEKKNDPEFMQKRRDSSKRYRERNSEKAKAAEKKWREKNPGYSAMASKRWREENPEKREKYRKERYAIEREDPEYVQNARRRSIERHEKLKNDPEYIKKRKDYYDSKKDTPEWKEYRKKYRKEHLEERRIYTNERYASDIQYKLSRIIRGRLHKVVSREQKVGSAVHDLGCTLEELKIHLENQFKEGMTWDNWKPDGWHIDHIKPLSKFDLTDPVQFKEAVHYTNLQPLWWNENFEKSDKWVDRG